MQVKVAVGIQGQDSKLTIPIVHGLEHIERIVRSRVVLNDVANAVMKEIRTYPDGSFPYVAMILDNIIMTCETNLRLNNGSNRVSEEKLPDSDIPQG